MPAQRIAPGPSPRSTALVWWLALFVATLLAYSPALRAGFIWDDQPGHVTKPELRSLAGLARIWFEVGATQQYYPLLHSAFWVEHKLWGDAPFGYHLVNVLLHALSACLVGTILRRLAVPGAWFAAALLALHPVCVESVAWISEQKNTLSTVFYLLAALTYLRFDASATGDAAPSPRSTGRGEAAVAPSKPRCAGLYSLATALFVAALLTKTVTATLPAALLVIVWWQRGRIDARRDVAPLAPWFAAGLGAGLLTAWVEHAQIGAQGGDYALDAFERMLVAGRAAWFYLGKLIWPADLTFIYPRWTIDATQGWQWVFPLAAGALLVALAWVRRRSRGPLAAALFFGGTLFPALGFVNVFPFVYSFVADHFQYVACLGVFALTAAGGAQFTATWSGPSRRAFGIGILTSLAALTWQHASTYRDVFTLYRDTIARNPGCWMAHNNLAIALVDAGRATEALPHYEQALRHRPNYPEAENNFGYALTQLGRAAEALPHLDRALSLKPHYADAHNNRGAALMALGRVADGTAAFGEAVRLNPQFALAHLNHGRALAAGGRIADAILPLRTAVELQPGFAEAHFYLAVAFKQTGRDAEAERHMDRAVKLGFRR